MTIGVIVDPNPCGIASTALFCGGSAGGRTAADNTRLDDRSTNSSFNSNNHNNYSSSGVGGSGTTLPLSVVIKRGAGIPALSRVVQRDNDTATHGNELNNEATATMGTRLVGALTNSYHVGPIALAVTIVAMSIDGNKDVNNNNNNDNINNINAAAASTMTAAVVMRFDSSRRERDRISDAIRRASRPLL